MTQTFTLAALLLAVSLSASAQFVGPAGEASSVSEIRSSLPFDRFVTLRGQILRQVGKELYEFRDASGSLWLDIDHKHWQGLPPVGADSKVEVDGKYVPKTLGLSKLKVISLRVLP